MPVEDASALEETLTRLGEPGYRAGQVLRWLYEKRATSFEAMTDLRELLREARRELQRILWTGRAPEGRA